MQILFFIAIPFAVALLFLMHLAVYKGLISIFALTSYSVLLGIKIIMLILGGGFIVSNIIDSQYNNNFTRVFYTVTASWYGFLFYMFLAVAVYFIFATLLGNVVPAPVTLLGKALISCAIVVSIYGLWNAERVVFTRYDVSLPGLPEAWQGKRAVWISDVHLDQVHNVEYSRRLVDAIQKENPDIVFIGGDLYDGVKIDERSAIAPFGELKPKDGIYFITGNHEEFSDAGKARYINAVKEAGIRILNNKMINVGGVDIIGVDDRDSTQANVFETILAGLHMDKNTPSILLKHQPAQLDIAEKFGINMQISGHTHEAQVYPLGYVTKLMYHGYDYGRKNLGAMQVFTSSGVGTWGPPLRVGTRPEILVFTFK